MAMTCYSMAWLSMVMIFGQQREAHADICTDPICTFHLYVKLTKTMHYRDDGNYLVEVTFNGSQPLVDYGDYTKMLTMDDAVYADGVARDVILFNGTLPGPTLEVMEGSQVQVIVHNQLRQKTFSIHWHGMLQTKTYFMDGSAYVTQCPTLPGQSFKYTFVASPAGTHWYHPHLGSMRVDGAYGMLIVHNQIPINPYFAISVNDWYNSMFDSTEMMYNNFICSNGNGGPDYRSPGSEKFDCSFDGADLYSYLYESSLFDELNRIGDTKTPLKEYVVQPNLRYRFRMVHTGNDFPLQISVDGHKLYIVASNGADIQPILVDSFFFGVSETIDFEMDTDQKPSRYWFRADTQCAGKGAKGILVYQGFEKNHKDPISQPRNCTPASPCVVFNCPFGRYPDSSNKRCIPMVDARSTLSKAEQQLKYGINDSNVVELFLNFAMNVGPSVNGRRFMMPSEPLFQNPHAETDCYGQPCLDGCSCQCTNIIDLPHNRTIRLIISNLQPNANISQHASSGTTKTSPITDITCGGDMACAHPRWTISKPQLNFNNPVIKDVVILPARGYIVIQFVSNNPGYWMLHCHNEVHMGDGMAVVLKVDPDRLPLPDRFPTCSQFV